LPMGYLERRSTVPRTPAQNKNLKKKLRVHLWALLLDGPNGEAKKKLRIATTARYRSTFHFRRLAFGITMLT
jgi:hypothetical protein